MTVYFTASIVGKKYYLENYLKIVDFLSKKGYKVISNHIIRSSPTQVNLETKIDRLKFHDQLIEWIDSSDCIVAETSFPSISVGYEISLALHRNKPVLILYSNGSPPSLLAHHKDEKLICEKYNQNTLTEIIADFLNFAQSKEDSRFTFYTTSQIASFLEEVSNKEKLPKAVWLRKLIEREMKCKK